MFVITDLSDSITVKIFADPEQQKMLLMMSWHPKICYSKRRYDV